VTLLLRSDHLAAPRMFLTKSAFTVFCIQAMARAAAPASPRVCTLMFVF
jgi:hypothetical protein